MTEQIQELLPYNLTLLEPYTIEVYTMSVEKIRGCEAIKSLSEKYPFLGFGLSHLKRANKSQCKSHITLIIAPKEQIEELDQLEEFAYSCENCGIFNTASVPKIPPYTKKQLFIWSKQWPCILEQPTTIPYVHSAEEAETIIKLASSLSENTVLLYVPTSEYSSKGELGPFPLQHEVMQAINNFQVVDEKYLCTDAFAFCYYEPCIMCAMALVHSRVQRVYYLMTTEQGAFTYWKLHERSVNYMYRIFQIIV